MCLTLPGRVTSIDPAGVTVDIGGHLRRASTQMAPELDIGDWVLVAMGTVLEKLEPDIAQQVNEALLEAMEFEDTDTAAAALVPS